MPVKNAKETNFLSGKYEVIDPKFGGEYNRVELDLGCGKGGFSLEVAKRNPDTIVLAADIKASRLQKINNKAALMKISNLETIRVMAWDLIAYQLPNDCLDRVHILCPDPWPKFKHKGHRLVTSEFLGAVTRVLKNGGILHLSTDDRPYVAWMKEAISGLSQYIPFEEGIDDVKDIETEFERHYVEVGKGVVHMTFKLSK
ncbi:MAG: methyltransferase domain-containing protein [Lentisphaeraceae bacterium]|nr:methyltransferase domain-containing protein [Lentisphaeraceae bacterium]